MTGLDAQRDDGPLGTRPSRRPVPLPEPALVLLAVLVGTLVPAVGAPGPAWWYVLAATVLALVARWGGHDRNLAWTVPALLRALEYGAVLVIVGDHPAGYGLLAALAFHHYDIVYRLRLQGAAPPAWRSVAVGGWAGRLAVLVIAAAAGATAVVVPVLATVVAAVGVTESVSSWIRNAARTGAADAAIEET